MTKSLFFLEISKDFLPQSPEIGGGKAEDGGEHTGEMKRVSEAHFFPHLFDQCARLLQAFGSVVHLEPLQALIRRLLVVAAKQPAQIGAIDVAFASNLFQSPQSQAVLLNVAATLLIS